MSAFSNPVIVKSNKTAHELKRIPLTQSDEGQFSEKWMQTAIYENPKCLPIREIDAHIGELIPVCTEIVIGNGRADILFITPTGKLVLIETKLWRNPEARREVVVQILDYAKELTRWTFDDLARQAAIATGMGPQYLLKRLEEFTPEADTSAFVDGINLSLKTGDFLLLIVGDGIRSGVRELVEFIEQYGNLRFGLGLIEVAAFQLPDTEDILIQPRILARTEILQRSLLLGPSGPVEFETAATLEDTETKAGEDTLWFQKFWEEYLRILRLDDGSQPPPKIPKSRNIFLSMPPGGSSAWLSAYIAPSTGNGGVYLTFSKNFEYGKEFYEALLANKDSIEEVVGLPLSWHSDGNKFYISIPTVPLGDLNQPESRQKLIEYLAKFSNSMVNAFRPRLDYLSQTVLKA